jgi:succinate dehydrogenase / fumarate reductase membrane anchor subunit
MRTPLGKVRGLGSSKSGTGDFIALRVTSVALLILLALFVVAVVMVGGQPYGVVRATLGAPFWAVVLLAGILLTTVHMRIGMQVIIEDYVHEDMLKFAALIANWLFAWGVGLTAAFAVLKLAFGA